MPNVIALGKKAASDWMEDNAPRLGAALSFYSLLSLAPLLVIAVGIAGLVFGATEAEHSIVAQMRGLVGEQGAEAVQAMMQNAQKPGAGIFASLLAVATLLFGASGVFGELRDALNTVWEVPTKASAGVMDFVRQRIFSFGLVLAVGFLLLVAMLVSAVLAAASSYFEHLLPLPGFVFQGSAFVVSLGVAAGLFALMFRYIPDARLPWPDIWVGAGVTAVLFTIGKFLIGLYLGNASVGSAYGAAGSLVIVLLWVYYSSQIVFFGAEFTQAWVEAKRAAPESGPAEMSKPPAAPMVKRREPAPGNGVVATALGGGLAALIAAKRLLRQRRA